MKARFVVSATINHSETHSSTLNEHIEATTEAEAECEARRFVMDMAYKYPDGPWGRGEIMLTDRGSKKILRESDFSERK